MDEAPSRAGTHSAGFSLANATGPQSPVCKVCNDLIRVDMSQEAAKPDRLQWIWRGWWHVGETELVEKFPLGQGPQGRNVFVGNAREDGH